MNQLSNILQKALNNDPTLGTGWTVEFKKPQSMFLILKNGLAPDNYNYGGDNFIGATENSTASIWGFFTATGFDRPLLRDVYNYKFERTFTGILSEITIAVYPATITIPEGTYTPELLAPILQTQLNDNTFLSAKPYTVSFDDPSQKFVFTKKAMTWGNKHEIFNCKFHCLFPNSHL